MRRRSIISGRTRLIWRVRGHGALLLVGRKCHGHTVARPGAGTAVCAVGVAALAAALKTNTKVARVNLCGEWRRAPRGRAARGGDLVIGCMGVEIRAAGTGLNAAGAVTIAEALKVNESIVALSIHGARLACAGGRKTCRRCPTCCPAPRQEISLATSAIAEALGVNPRVEMVKLGLE